MAIMAMGGSVYGNDVDGDDDGGDGNGSDGEGNKVSSKKGMMASCIFNIFISVSQF